MNCADLLVLVASAALDSQQPDGFMAPGHNGPYGDPETPVRNTSHWMQTFLKAYSLTGDSRFEEAAYRSARALLRPELRAGGYTFHYRTAPGKDRCSGLIGQAWTIEALAQAASHFGSPEHARLGEDVVRMHAFDRQCGLWHICEVDGSRRGFDQTLNHQLWFAAAASRLLDQSVDAGPADLRQMVDTFLDRLPGNMVLYADGLIYHDSILYLRLRRWRIATIPSRLVGTTLFPHSLRRHPWMATIADLYLKCVGYHAFCAYACATLKRQLPSHPFWRSPLVPRIARYLLSPDYVSLLYAEGRYGFPYNAPGFEVPFAVATLMGNSDLEAAELASAWVTAQARRTLDLNSMRFARGTPDPATLTARIYELSSLPDEVLRGAALGDLN